MTSFARAIVVFALVLLPGCARCPSTTPLGALPQAIAQRIRINTQARAIRVEDPSPPDGPVTLTLPELVGLDEALAWDAGAEEGISLPIRRSGGLWTLPATVLGVDGSRSRVPALRLDTGMSGPMSLSAADAAALGLTLVQEVPPGEAFTAFGKRSARFGVLAALDLGPVAIAPVGAQAECSGPRFAPLLGMDTLESFGHAIFDWPNRRLILLPPGSLARTDTIRARPEWRSTPWTRGPIAQRRDSLDAPGQGRREFTIDAMVRWCPLTIDGVTHAAMIDTGFSADLFAFDAIADGADARDWSGTGFGRRQTFSIADAPGPVNLAGVTLEGLTLLQPPTPPANFAQRAGIGVVVGLGVLERFPLWLDMERDELRLWMSEGPLPEFLE